MKVGASACENSRPEGVSPTLMTESEARRIQRRVNTLLRDRDAVRRMLDQADMERVARDVGRQTAAIDRIENELAGKADA